MQRNLTFATKTVRVSNAVAAGTTEIYSASVNISNPGFSGVRAICLLNALTAGQQTRLKLQGSPDNATWSDLAGTGSGTNGSGSGYAADADGNKLLIAEAFRPGGGGYIRAAVDRGAQNAAIDGIILELFLAAREPVAQDATVSQYAVTVAPTPGTA